MYLPQIQLGKTKENESKISYSSLEYASEVNPNGLAVMVSHLTPMSQKA